MPPKPPSAQNPNIVHHYHQATPWTAVVLQFLIIGSILYWCIPSFRNRVKKVFAWWSFMGEHEPTELQLVPNPNRLHVFGERVAAQLQQQQQQQQPDLYQRAQPLGAEYAYGDPVPGQQPQGNG